MNKKLLLYQDDSERSFFMSRYKVEISGVNTADIKVLTNEEMKELFIKMQNGDKFAKDDLVNGNLKLVLSMLKRFQNKADSMDDLFQIGCVGLIKAIDNFDLKHEVRFSTYAVPMILGEVKRYLRDNNSVRIARSIKDIAYKSLRKKEELTNLNGREPSIKEIAEHLELEEYVVVNALDSLKGTISMFEPIYNDGGDTIYLADQIGDEDNKYYSKETHVALNVAMKQIKEKEKYVIHSRYIIGKTQMELAKEIGISQAQISRIEKSGLQNIKKLID